MKYIISSLTLLLLLFSPLCYSQKSETGDNPSSPQGDPIRAYLNLNNISTVFKNTGISDIDVGQSNSGFVYPFGTGKAAVFISGLLWGVKIAGDPQVRVGGSTYMEGLQGGWIDEFGNVIDPDDPGARIYRIRPDVFPSGPFVDLSREASDEGKSTAEVRAQYELDWTEWPADLGAPFFDANNNGIYDPDPSSGDVPGIDGAAQTIWFVANDQEQVLTLNLYGTLPIGIEYQATIWAYAQTGALGNMFFRKYKLINKTDVLGNPTTFEDMYISMWSDPDIGNSTDDFVGCDTLLDLGFAYNGIASDPIYDPLPPPTVGFDLIRGPLVEGNPGEDKNRNGIEDIYDYGLTENNKRIFGFINLPMTAFYYFVRGDPVLTDPPMGDSEGANQFYNFMQGKIGITGDPFIDPVTNQPTTFSLNGNPVTRIGWIDGILHPPGDRRLGLSTGPLQMAPGDTQIVVIAEIAGGAIPGVDYLAAINLVKFYSSIAQNFYDAQFPLPVPVNDETVNPLTFELHQNYPNPFNPNTSIQYAISNRQFVSLKVYDVLGNEIATLVNEEKPAGEYEVVFNSAGLPSGIYFYQLRAGSFVETKKMVFMK
jgi:hypothetical protein